MTAPFQEKTAGAAAVSEKFRWIVSLDSFSVQAPDGHHILNSVSLQIVPGRFTALLGSSGAGKTTLLRAILHLLPTGAGWKTDGFLDRFPGLRVGWVAQNPGLQLFRNFVHEELGFSRVENAAAFLEPLELASLAGRRCAELSQGEKTMVVLARSLHQNPHLLVLDEVMVNLSAARRDWFRRLLADFVGCGGAVLAVEHSPELLDSADAVVRLADGKLSAVSKSAAEQFLRPDMAAGTDRAPRVPADPALELRGLADPGIASTKDRPLNLQIHAGEILGISGPNGCGKTTLLNFLAGFQPPRAGNILWRGRIWKTFDARRGIVSFVTQEPLNQFFTDTPEKELGFSIHPENADAAAELLDEFHLTARRNRPIHSLSYGEQQRLALAAALTGRPQLLLLDEPTYGMDRNNLRLFARVLRKERERGCAVVLASHEQDLLKHWADGVVSL